MDLYMRTRPFGLHVKEGLSFLDVQKEFLESKPKPRAQSYTSTLCCSWELMSITQTKYSPHPDQT
jgi:hypothetical protein